MQPQATSGSSRDRALVSLKIRNLWSLSQTRKHHTRSLFSTLMSSLPFLRITGRSPRPPSHAGCRYWTANTLSRTSRIYPGSLNIGQRWSSSRSASSTSLLRGGWRRPRVLVAGGLLLLIGIGTSNTIRADSDDNQDKDNSVKSTDPLSTLIRSYIVYSLCSIPALVDSAPTLLQVFTSIPVIGTITEGLVRVTFFNQFVGGDTALGTIPLLRALRLSNKGALFAYSIEVDEHEATAHLTKKKPAERIHKRIVNEMIRSIDVAADFEDEILRGAPTGRRTWVAVKMTALLPDAQSLINLSKYLTDTRTPLPVLFPGCPRSTDIDILYDRRGFNRNHGPLSDDDVVALRELHQDLRRICARAQQRGVKIILDAEYSWYQPAIDALQLSLMCEFNTTTTSKDLSIPNVQPLIYGTFQAYLRRTPAYLEHALKDAKANGYSLGVKLVRGAYHTHEVAALEDKRKGKPSLSITPESQPPVWSTKDETDRCYNECLQKLITSVKDDIQSKGPQPMIGVLFGTHNWTSSRLILSELVRNGIAKAESVVGEKEGVVVVGDEVTERVALGQLYGMNDALSDYLARRTRSSAPMVIKYVPYGALPEVMPYLSRRAIENKSVLGNGTAREERIRARKAIVGKLFG